MTASPHGRVATQTTSQRSPTSLDASKAASASLTVVVALSAAWYAFAAAAGVGTKPALRHVAKASDVASALLALTAAQFALTAVIAGLDAILRKGVGPSDLLSLVLARTSGAQLPPRVSLSLGLAAALHSLANLATNAATAAADAHVVQIIKAMEPLFSLCFQPCSSMYQRRIVAVLIVVAGGAVSGGLSMGEALTTAAGMTGIALALLSNLLFAARNVHSKSAAAAMPGGGSAVLAFSSATSACVLGCALLVYAGGVQPVLHLYRAIPTHQLLLSCIGFAGYSTASYAVLDAVDPVTHALINVGKRVTVVTATSLWFGTHMSASAQIAFGVMMLGMLLYNDALAQRLAGLHLGPKKQ